MGTQIPSSVLGVLYVENSGFFPPYLSVINSIAFSSFTINQSPHQIKLL